MPAPLEGVVDLLQASLQLHLSQGEAYTAQSEHFTRWGYPALGKTWGEYAEEELSHAKMLLKRLEFFDASPNLDHGVTEWPRHDFEGILASNYEGDEAAAKVERSGFVTCTEVGDAVTAKIFTKLLRGSEDSMANIEAIQKIIEQIGAENYLANQTE
jgi:bacterioferritin (cytochrome b1)